MREKLKAWEQWYDDWVKERAVAMGTSNETLRRLILYIEEKKEEESELTH